MNDPLTALENLPSHVIAAFLQFDHSPAVIASLPARLLCCFQEFVGLLILGTVLCAMPFPITKTANLCLTTTALPVLLAILLMDTSRLDPFATPSGRTIYTIFGGILCEFRVPIFLEFIIK